MNNLFSLTRTAKIIRKDIFSEYKNLLIWIGASASVMIVISAINILFQKLNGTDVTSKQYFHSVFYILFLFPGGYLMTSAMFKDLHDKSKNIYWLSMPGSIFEKMISRLLICSVLYVLLLTLIYPVLAALSEVFNLLLFNLRHDFFNPFNRDLLKLLPYYLVTQSVFFAGAVYFRKHPLAKTLLSLAVFLIVLSIITITLLRIFFGSYFSSIQELNLMGSSYEVLNSFINFMRIAAKILFWGILTPFFYGLSYLKLSEKEVRDGI